MKTYKVRITAYVETSQIVEAEDEDQACELAQQEWSDNYIVQNTYSKNLSNFTEIVGYEPEEVI